MTADASERPPAVIDPRPGQLLEKYASLVGALLLELADGLLELEIPAAERDYWAGEGVVRIALVPDALDEDPEAELLGIGTPVFERLLLAIRDRGFLEQRGTISATTSPAAEAALLPIPLLGAQAGEPAVEVTLVPVGRLLARIVIQAGPLLEERLVESPLVDFSSGARVPDAILPHLDGPRSESPDGAASPVLDRRRGEELLPLLFDEMETQLRGELDRIRAEAERARHGEVARLERYYTALLADVEPGDGVQDAKTRKQVIERELERRRGEEDERHRVRVTVHPLQLTEWHLQAQRATWSLEVPGGKPVSLSATRFLTGETTWGLTCPTCGGAPEAIAVCAEGHPCCPGCSEACGVCLAVTCRGHGLGHCAPGDHATCPDHGRTCGSCGTSHCTAHSGHCVAGDHEVCPECAVACGHCGLAICRGHAIRSTDGAPRGARWLCQNCTVQCEGGTNEAVGVDEVVRCTTCERYICEVHLATCAVDNRPQCSRHLRRSDHSGRLVCEEHRLACEAEPGSILASDEVAACATCGLLVCEQHSDTCIVDGRRHCTDHLLELRDMPGAKACEQHRSVCHVDQVTFSVEGTLECPVCGRAACERHRIACSNCGRQVCVADADDKVCRTCRSLEETADPPDDLIQASLLAAGGEPPKARSWWTARDVSGVVVELKLGWTRRLVFWVPHGDMRPGTVVAHSLMGSRKVR